MTAWPLGARRQEHEPAPRHRDGLGGDEEAPAAPLPGEPASVLDTVDEAITILADPDHPAWLQAFAFLLRHPEAAGFMGETFGETLKEMGVQPGGVNPATADPVFDPEAVARASGVPESVLEEPPPEGSRATDGESTKHRAARGRSPGRGPP